MRYTLVVLLAIGFAACKKKKTESTPAATQLQVEVNPVFGTDNLYIDSNYSLSDGSKIQFKEIHFFFTHVQNGSSLLTDAALFDYRGTGHAFISGTGDQSNYGALQVNVGVDSATNHSNPAAFPDNSCLNISNCGDMHWNWNVGYIFVKIEAKADTINDGIDNFDHNIVWHCGTDLNYSQVNFPLVNWTSSASNTKKAFLRLDMKNVIENTSSPLNIKTEAITHSGISDMPIAQKVMQNFCASISAE